MDYSCQLDGIICPPPPLTLSVHFLLAPCLPKAIAVVEDDILFHSLRVTDVAFLFPRVLDVGHVIHNLAFPRYVAKTEQIIEGPHRDTLVTLRSRTSKRHRRGDRQISSISIFKIATRFCCVMKMAELISAPPLRCHSVVRCCTWSTWFNSSTLLVHDTE